MSDYPTRRVMMVDTQVRPSDVTKFPIIEAMLSVPREAYVPTAKREAAYVGEDLVIAPGRVLVQARTFAKLLDALDIQPAETALDIGCGLGYSAAVMARLAKSVVAVEEDATLASQTGAVLAAQSASNVTFVQGALAAGNAAHCPYDVITLQGGVQTVPDALLAQLAEGGRIGAIFMQGALGVVKIGHKSNGQVTWRAVFNATAPILPGFAVKAEFAL
jgi:protein-L-isoaspartate(D-aspartate) O-methyltransferase